ncbi:hypothetical protein D9M71_498850 [compost metagenome]
MQVQRLVQDVHRATFIALERIVHVAAGGADENDRDVLGHFRTAHQFGQLETVHSRHLHVENGHGELMLQQQGQGFVRRHGLVHSAVVGADQCFKRQQVFRQVVDDQQFRFDVA